MSIDYTAAELYPDSSANTSAASTSDSHTVAIAVASTLAFIFVLFLLCIVWGLHMTRTKKTGDVEKAKEGVSAVEIEGWKGRMSEDTQVYAESVSSIVKE
jgi:hypothetical protein